MNMAMLLFTSSFQELDYTIQTQFTPAPGSSMNFKYVISANGPKCYETIYIDPQGAFINKNILSFPQEFGLKANNLLRK